VKPICHACKDRPAGNYTDPNGWGICADCARSLLKSGATIGGNVRGVDQDGRSPPGAEPWWWRPYREMLDPEGNVVIDQPAPPVHVPRAAPRATTSKGLPLRPGSEIAALDALTLEQRQVLQLQLQGHDYAAIAMALGIGVTTVRERLRRARAALRKGA
jgi:hypothetical protein